MIEFAEGGKILFEARLGATAGTDDCGARGVESRIDHGAALGVSQPRHALCGQIKAEQDLEHGENFEKEFHATRA